MRGAWVAVGALILACLTGCGSSHVTLQVTPRTSPYPETLRIRASGLDGGEHVILRMRTDDADGHAWQATEKVTADGSGAVRVTGVRLVSELRPTHGGKEQAFDPPEDWTEEVAVLDGDHVRARHAVRRIVPATSDLVTSTTLRPRHGGLYGVLYQPADATGERSAVVVWSGSGGGLNTTGLAADLAAQGHPSLALAYFHVRGLPDDLERIPLEYFARAVRRLDRAPHVDPRRVFVFGDSRGSEAAMLTAIDFPGLVHGVVAGVPNAVAGTGLPDSRVPAWTLHGRAVPDSQDAPDAPDDPAAKLAVQRFPGRVLAVCGGDDAVWDSCVNAAALKRRSPDRVTVLSYPDAGHDVGSMLPGFPYTTLGGRTAAGDVVVNGGDPADTALARADAWPKLLAFLQR